MNWRGGFDHVSFAILCFMMVFGVAIGTSLDDLAELFACLAFWTVCNSYEFAKKDGYRRSLIARRLAMAFYGAAFLWAMLLLLLPGFAKFS
ncbi:MAG: hypothetical protein JF564_02250 [Sphingomonas sp.]|nr:hypothetical protein [Sphingomonas sp.]